MDFVTTILFEPIFLSQHLDIIADGEVNSHTSISATLMDQQSQGWYKHIDQVIKNLPH